MHAYARTHVYSNPSQESGNPFLKTSGTQLTSSTETKFDNEKKIIKRIIYNEAMRVSTARHSNDYFHL